MQIAFSALLASAAATPLTLWETTTLDASIDTDNFVVTVDQIPTTVDMLLFLSDSKTSADMIKFFADGSAVDWWSVDSETQRADSSNADVTSTFTTSEDGSTN